MDYKEGFGNVVEGAGRQGIEFSRNDVAKVIIGMGRFPQGEFGNSGIALILVVKKVFHGIKEVTWQRRILS